MRKLLQKQESGSKKPKKGAAPPPAESKLTVGLIYVNENYDGWKEQCLRVLQSNFDNEALKNCFIDRETNFKQVQKLCMPFIRFKKDEARNVGPQALNWKLPFGEMDVLEGNLELIRRQLWGSSMLRSCRHSMQLLVPKLEGTVLCWTRIRLPLASRSRYS